MPLFLLAAYGSAGAEPAPEKKVVAEASWIDGFGGSLIFDSFVGIGTFVGNRHTDNPYWASTLTLMPNYEVFDDFTVGAFFSLTAEWTRLVTPCHDPTGPRPAGAPQRDCSDTEDANNQRFNLLDVELSASHSKLFEVGPLSASAFGAVAFPTSRISRHANNILSLGAGATGKLAYAPITVTLGFRFYKHFPTAEAAVLNAIEVEERAAGQAPIGRCASFRSEACVGLQGFVANYNVSAKLGVTFDWPWVDGLSTSASLSYLYARRFGSAPDQFSSPLFDSDGNPVVTGANFDDSTIGAFDISYAFTDYFTLSFGIFSWQPARTADGKRIRFPFYDFVSPANNFTTWYLTGTASL